MPDLGGKTEESGGDGEDEEGSDEQRFSAVLRSVTTFIHCPSREESSGLTVSESLPQIGEVIHCMTDSRLSMSPV